jgi:hypothetical protein
VTIQYRLDAQLASGSERILFGRAISADDA